MARTSSPPQQACEKSSLWPGMLYQVHGDGLTPDNTAGLCPSNPSQGVGEKFLADLAVWCYCLLKIILKFRKAERLFSYCVTFCHALKGP